MLNAYQYSEAYNCFKTTAQKVSRSSFYFPADNSTSIICTFTAGKRTAFKLKAGDVKIEKLFYKCKPI
jgi:hypothetical protein